jgi:DHA1 family multidrug resistance protein-like MFS transporter
MAIAAAPRQHWVKVMLIFAVAGAVETFGFGQLGAFTPLYLQHLRVPASEIPRWTGILASLAFVIGIPLAPFWGVWADKYSRKLIIARSAYLEALLFLTVAVSQTVWQLAAARVLVGFVLGNTGVMFAAQTHLTPRRRVGFALSVVAMGNALGLALGPLAGGLLVSRTGYPALFAIDAALSLLSGVLITVGYREDPERTRSEERVPVMLRRSLEDIVQVRWVLTLFFAYFTLLLGSRILQPFIPIFIAQVYRAGPSFGGLPTTIGVSVTLVSVATAVFAPVWGRLGDRAGYYRVMGFAAAGVAATLLLQSFATDLPQLLAPAIAQGAFQGAFTGLFSAIIALGVAEARRASVLNLTFFPFYLAGVLAPAIGTVLYSLGIRNLFRISALLMVGAMLLVRISAAAREQPGT